MAISSSVTVRARHVDDDARGLGLGCGSGLMFDGEETAEEEAGSISHDGGAARGDFVAGEEFVKFAEGAVDGDSRSEFLGVTDEPGGDVGGVAVSFQFPCVAEA